MDEDPEGERGAGGSTRVQEELARRTREVATLAAAVSALVRMRDAEACLREIEHEVAQRLGVPAGGILLLDSSSGLLRLVEPWGLPQPLVRAWQSIRPEGFHAEQVLRTGRSRLMKGQPVLAVLPGLRGEPIDESWTGHLCVPLGPRARPLGILFVFGGEALLGGPREVAFFESLGEIAGLAIEWAIEKERRAQTQAWLREVLESVREGIAILAADEGGEHAVAANRRFSEIFGVPAGEIVGREAAVLESLVAASTSDPERAVRALRAQGGEGAVCRVRPHAAFLALKTRVIEDGEGRRTGRLWMVTEVQGEGGVRLGAAPAGVGESDEAGPRHGGATVRGTQCEAGRVLVGHAGPEEVDELASGGHVSPRTAIHRVLVCEKDPAVVGLLRGLMQGEGLEVEGAVTLAEAARAFEEHRPDAILVGFLLDRPGFELLPLLPWKGRQVGSRVVFLAERGEKGYPNLPLPPIVGWMRDPWDRSALGHLVAEVCGPAPGILVVEDDDGAAEMIASRLREMGAQVETASSGVKAVRACPRMRPDLVLLDLRMPAGDAVFVLETLRKAPGLEETPVALYTEGDLRAEDRTALADAAERMLGRSRVGEREFLERISRRIAGEGKGRL